PEPGLKTANEINLGFLALVAVWRVALLIWFLQRGAGLSPVASFAGAFFPIALIVIGLTALNLEEAVFNIMSGRDAVHTPNDDSYIIMMMISILSLYAALPILIIYGFCI